MPPTPLENRAGRRRFPGPCLPFLLLGAMLLAAAPKEVAAQSYNVRHYTNEDGLPQSQILALHQSAEGYLWIATYGGVGRYDGSSIRTYTTAHGLSSNLVQAIAEDGDGRLYFGTLGGGICVLEEATFRCLSEAEGLPTPDIADLVVDGDGTVWAATDVGLLRIRGSEVAVTTTADGLPSDEILSLALAPDDGSLWIGTAAGLARLESGVVREVYPEHFTGAAIRMIGALASGTLIGTDDALRLLSPEGVRPLSPPTLPPGTAFHDAAFDLEGNAWIATNAGLLRFDGSGFLLLTQEQGLPVSDIRRVMVDREGNVWAGTDRGMGKLVPGPFLSYSIGEGLPHPFTRAVAEDAEGRLWVGTREGAARWNPATDRFEVTVPATELPDPRVYSLAPAPEGGMLVGTRDGLVHWIGGTFHRLGVQDGLPAAYVLSLRPDGEGGVWIGTERGVARWREGAIESFPSGHPLSELFAVSLALDADGRLWVGLAAGGVRVWDGEELTALDGEGGLTNQVVWSIARDSGGRMWVGSNGEGVFRVDGREITRFSTEDGLSNDFIWQVLVDLRDDVWLYSNQGLTRYRSGRFEHFGTEEGLIELEGTASATLEDAAGRLWFGSAVGVMSYDPTAEHANPVPPPVSIEEVTVAGIPLDRQGELRFPSGLVHLRFSALTFRDERSVRFRYRLARGDPVNDPWSEYTSERTVSFASLAPGRYTFQVEAISGAGIPSELPATLEFTVTPSLWQSWWVRGLGLLALGLLITGAVLVRVRRIEVERERLERVVEERTAELQSVNDHLRDQIQERERVETALKESEARLREIVENTTNVFYSHTSDNELTYISPRVKELLGVDPEKAPVRWTEFATDHPINDEGRRITERALQTGERQPPYELELRHADGRLVRVRVLEAPVIRDGEVVQMVGSLTDITEVHAAEEERRKLENQLRQAQKMEAVGRLAAGIAHDFNNLLTSIMGHNSLMQLELGEDHPLRSDLDVVEQACRRAAGLVAQLLAFGRKQMSQPTPQRVNEAVAGSVRMLESALGANVRIETELTPEDPRITIDRSQLEHILLSLGRNARDAMPKGGTLSICTGVVEQSDLAFEWESDDPPTGRYAILQVVDTGEGMSAETVERAFEPFFTTKGPGGGSGLGLATVYGIVKQNRGHIHLDTEPGQGTTATIYLPETPAPE